MDIKNWKQSPKIQEAKEKLEDEKVRGFMRWGFEIVVTLVLAAMVGIMLFQTVTMQESSMEPTIAVGDRFFINRVVYKFSSPKRGDRGYGSTVVVQYVYVSGGHTAEKIGEK